MITSAGPAVALAIVLGLLTTACGTNTPPTGRPSVAPASSSVQPSASAAAQASNPPETPSPSPARTIDQPVVPSNVPIAPDSARVDLTLPTFSNPTQITNPLFPVSKQESVLFLGHVDGKPFRTEVTLLPFTRIVEWEGQRVETLVSQYCAYLDGRIQEVAYDLYAQADDGSVWYFGEDVGDFENGAMVTKEGTWLAGKDAPAAMIMAATPKVGDVFRTENSPGFAFEEVTVKSIDQPLDGPTAPIPGGIVVSELHMDATTENKHFAPGYGEFYTASGPDVEALALAVPVNRQTGSVPAALTTVATGAGRVFTAVGSKDWKSASAQVRTMAATWAAYKSGGIPKLIEPAMNGALTRLARTVAARDPRRARLAALEVARSSFDLQLPYRPATEIDLARFDLWAAEAIVDATAGDAAGVRGDAFTLSYIRDRILGAVDGPTLSAINSHLLDLQVAEIDGDLKAAAAAASMLRDVVHAS